ncbi:MAG: ABC transporter substrate-binding protein [Hyphomicrobiales bacterium]
MRSLFKPALIAALLAASSLLDAPAASAQDLNFSIPLPLSGPLSFTGTVEQGGWQHVVDYINKNGGIRGRKIVATYWDDEYKVDIGVAGFKKAAAEGGVVFSSGDGTPFIRAISPENNERYKILISNQGFSSDLIDTAKYKYHFLPGLTYSDMVDLLFRYIKSKQGNGAAPKVALVYSATEFGRDPIAHARDEAKRQGIDIVLEDETKFTGIDVTADAIKLRNAAADYVIFHGYAGNVWPEILKLSRDYGVKSQFMGTIFCADPEIVRGVGPVADGYIGVVPYNLVAKGSDAPTLKVIDGYLKSWTGKPYTGNVSIGYMIAWAQALILREIIGKAIDAGKPLDGETLIAEVKAMKNWDSGGIFAEPVTFVDQRITSGVLYQYHVTADQIVATQLRLSAGN